MIIIIIVITLYAIVYERQCRRRRVRDDSIINEYKIK